MQAGCSLDVPAEGAGVFCLPLQPASVAPPPLPKIWKQEEGHVISCYTPQCLREPHLLEMQEKKGNSLFTFNFPLHTLQNSSARCHLN